MSLKFEIEILQKMLNKAKINKDNISSIMLKIYEEILEGYNIHVIENMVIETKGDSENFKIMRFNCKNGFIFRDMIFKNIKEIREDREITQLELSQKSGVNFRMIQKYESGERNIDGAKLETLIKLSKVLKCNIRNILNNEKLKKECESIKL